MQLTGDRFTDVSAVFGNDLATMPNYPAEIRAPAGTIAGVSSFQVHISDHDIVTPGDAPNVLVAMNPAALKANLAELPPGSTILVNSDAFDERNLTKVGYDANPLDNGSLASYHVVQVPMTSLTLESCKELGVKPRDAERSKNFFALGLISWMYTRPVEPTIEWIDTKFSSRPQVRDANLAAFKAGLHFGETAELIEHYQIQPAKLEPGHYRNITGNLAVAYGLIAAAQYASLPILYASYPITPASDILHELSKHKNFGVRTLQAEDEIAAAAVAVGAAFAGQLGITATSGPGLDLKSEALGLAISLELPARRRRRAARRPVDRPAHQDRAVRPPPRDVRPSRRVAAADRRRVLAEPLLRRRVRGGPHRAEVPHAGHPPHRRLRRQRVRAVEAPRHRRRCRTSRCRSRRSRTTTASSGRTCATPRPSPVRGRSRARPGLMHRIGGIEKQDGTGNVNYEPANHELMTHIRADKVARIADDIPPVEVEGDTDAEVLVLGWGSTWGPISEAVRRVRASGRQGRARAPRAPQPVPGQPRRRAGALPEAARARDEPRPALAAGPGRVPGRRAVAHQGAGPALQRDRDRDQDPGDDRCLTTTATATAPAPR